MAVTSIPSYRESSNEVLLNALRGATSDYYQSRIPHVTEANIQETIRTLLTVPALRN